MYTIMLMALATSASASMGQTPEARAKAALALSQAPAPLMPTYTEAMDVARRTKVPLVVFAGVPERSVKGFLTCTADPKLFDAMPWANGGFKAAIVISDGTQCLHLLMPEATNEEIIRKATQPPPTVPVSQGGERLAGPSSGGPGQMILTRSPAFLSQGRSC